MPTQSDEHEQNLHLQQFLLGLRREKLKSSVTSFNLFIFYGGAMMESELINAIKLNTEVMFTNANIMLQTCNLDFILCDMPIWKHVYHMLHSCDQWYINPNEYTEPDFHEPNLNSLDIPSEKTLSRDELFHYLDRVRMKIMNYLDTLTDEMLYDVPSGCKSNRLSLILLQIRHFYAHLGNINATTIIETNKWPRVIGISGKSTEGLYE